VLYAITLYISCVVRIRPVFVNTLRPIRVVLCEITLYTSYVPHKIRIRHELYETSV